MGLQIGDVDNNGPFLAVNHVVKRKSMCSGPGGNGPEKHHQGSERGLKFRL